MGKNNKKRQIPPTVTDQIKLWEIERDRFTFKDGVLYSQFLSQNDFELLRNYASVSRYRLNDKKLIINLSTINLKRIVAI